ncbi:MAG TPA: Bax inhibitor-1/YccA family protein [Candidatus Limnocylindrales bacterium]|nr:Bax inhibitor-1/YccA family protein [Candidatus Limnocylindrales bacterium]
MMNSPYANPEQLGVRPSVQLSTAFLSQAFAWMFVALLVTTGVGTLVSTLPDESFATLANLWLFIIIGQLVLAFTLSLAIKRISATAALLLFFVFAATMGFTFGVILRTYELGSVLTAGVSAASIFAGAAIYGAVTKRNLASLGGYLFMALIGLLVAMVVNLFVGWETLNFIISVGGVLIFTGLTAFDVQRIQRGQLAAFTESMEKGAVMGAFVLYLDFVNLFLMLLRLFGNQR